MSAPPPPPLPIGVVGLGAGPEAGSYPYMKDLREMDSCRPAIPVVVPDELQVIATPLRLLNWKAELRQHPDQQFAHFLARGLEQGFRIGFRHGQCRCVSARRNMLLAGQHPEPIVEYLGKEVRLGRIIGPLSDGVSGVHVSRFGVIPKPHQPGKWRLITDLSSPEGTSVNDGIDARLCSLSYSSVDDAVRCITRLGRGAWLAKFDIESAYRLVPVHPQDRLLLGVSWKGHVYVDGALPFGLRSAPKLFTAVADALLWILGQHGVQDAIHYLDDYLLMSPPGCGDREAALRTSLRLCKHLGVPIADHKVGGASHGPHILRDRDRHRCRGIETSPRQAPSATITNRHLDRAQTLLKKRAAVPSRPTTARMSSCSPRSYVSAEND